MASLLERMEESGWVERRPHERDRRAYRIRLLAPGRGRYEVVRDLAVALQTDALGVLPVEDRESFLAQLELVAASCRKAAEDAPRSRA